MAANLTRITLTVISVLLDLGNSLNPEPGTTIALNLLAYSFNGASSFETLAS